MNKPTRTSRPVTALENEAWPKLSAEFLKIIKDNGSPKTLSPGEVLFKTGQDDYDFALLEQGELQVVDEVTDETILTIFASNFIGELGWLMGQKVFLTAYARTACTLITVARSRMLNLIATVPEVGDVVVSAFAARRRLLINWEEGGLLLIGDENDKTAITLREFVSRSQIPHRWVDRQNAAGLPKLPPQIKVPAEGTVAIIGSTLVLKNPSPRQLAQALGLDLAAKADELFDLVVVGAGPAGLAASIYAASEGLKVLAIEDTAIGGQAGTSSRIENYFGFPRGISGASLAYKGAVQAIKFGTRFTVPRRATQLRTTPNCFELALDDERCVRARAVVLANGVQYRRLPLDNLAELEGRGIYYAATDFEARHCLNANVVVVGGGNSAGQAAMFLSRYARCTYMVVRGEGLTATMSSYLSTRIEESKRIEVLTHTQISALHGTEHLSKVTLKNTRNGKEKVINCGALFIMIGAQPNTDWLSEQLTLDDKGFILTGQAVGSSFSDYQSSQPGIFAVGDIRAGSVKRVASAVGEGSVVVSSVHRYLSQVAKPAIA
jgi:thioredoxin reductase (NADPH)